MARRHLCDTRQLSLAYVAYRRLAAEQNCTSPSSHVHDGCTPSSPHRHSMTMTANDSNRSEKATQSRMRTEMMLGRVCYPNKVF